MSHLLQNKTTLRSTLFRWFSIQTALITLIIATTIGVLYQSNKMVEIHQTSLELEEATLDLIMLANEQVINPNPRIREQWHLTIESFKAQLIESEEFGSTYQYPQLFSQLAEIETIVNMIQRENLSPQVLKSLQPGLISQIYNLLSYSRQMRKAARQDYVASRPLFFISIALLVLIALISPILILRRMRRIFIDPIYELVESTKQIGQKDFTHAVPAASLQELNQLSQTMNRMRVTLLNEMALKSDLLTEVEQRKLAELEATRLLQQLKQNQDQMLQMEKLSAMGVMVGGVAHELNNPLMGIHNYIEYCLLKVENPKAKSTLQKAMVELERIQHLVKNMLIFSRSKKNPGLENVLLHSLVKSVTELMQPDFKKYGITVHSEIPEEYNIYSSPDLLKQVLVNLLSNARDALKQQDDAQIDIFTVASDKTLTLKIRDNGSGIPESAKLKIFDPFFTTKAAGEGTGLGLSISQELMQQLDSRLVLEDTSSKGTTFSIELPLLEIAPEE